MNEEVKILSMCPGSELDRRVADMLMDGTLENYSTDMGDAWKVVEKLEDLDWRIDIINSRKKKAVLGMKMVDGAPHTLNVLFDCPLEFETIPEGICKVALFTLVAEKAGW